MKRRYHPGGVVRGLDLVMATDPPPLPAWRHPLFQDPTALGRYSAWDVTADRDRELIEVTTLGQRGVQYVEGPCRHSAAVPVESVLGELVAWLCPGCDEQLPAEWRNA